MRFFRSRQQRGAGLFQHLQLPQRASSSLHHQLETERGKTRAAEETLERLQRQLRVEQEKTASVLAELRRTQQHFEEYKQRVHKRQEDTSTATTMGVCQQLIPLIDTLSHVFEEAPASLRKDPWFQGLYIASRELATMLKTLGMTRIGRPQNSLFDPTFYHADGLEYDPEVPEGTILRLVRAGFVFRSGSTEQVLRAAHVIVSTQEEPSDKRFFR